MTDISDQDHLRAAIERLYFGYRTFTDQADRILAQRGLGRAHHRILYFIGQRPDVSVRGLLDVLGVSKQALNGPLRQLMALGLVASASGTSDRRIRQLCLTPQGRALEADLTGVQMQLMRSAFTTAGDDAAVGWMTVMEWLALDRNRSGPP